MSKRSVLFFAVLILVFLSFFDFLKIIFIPQLRQLEFNSNIESCLDLVFIPEDYNFEEMSKYRKTVDVYYNSLLSVEPFTQYKDYINVWRIDTIVDFESERDPDMIRHLTINFNKVRRFVKNIIDLDLDHIPPDDQIIVIVDDSKYGGSGDVNVIVTYNGELGIRVMLHELGHSFGGLGDEYIVHDENYPSGVYIPYPNISWDGSEWYDIPDTDIYLGAWYRNLYRPTEDNCVMRRLDRGFCPVCKDVIISLLEHYNKED
jgi:hypothetical protein